MTSHFAEGPEDVLVFCLVQGEVMSVQMFLHCLKGLFDVAIPLQQLTHKEAHLILEIL